MSGCGPRHSPFYIYCHPLYAIAQECAAVYNGYISKRERFYSTQPMNEIRGKKWVRMGVIIVLLVVALYFYFTI